MDDAMPQRVLNLVNVSTSMFIVRFLSAHLDDFLGRYDTVMYSILVIQVSFLFGREYTLMRLSRRLSYLLIVEKIRPFATAWHDSNAFLNIQSLITNMLIIMGTALVPQSVAETSEGAIIITSTQFMYSDALNFIVRWHDTRLSVLVMCVVAVHALSAARPRSHIYRVLVTIASSICVTVVHAIITDWDDGADTLGRSDQAFGHGAETRLLYMALVATMAYGCAFFLEVAEPTRDYMVFLVASEIASAAHGWTWVVALLMGTACLRWWPGPRAWITQCMLLVLINVTVESVLSYIEYLAVHDTFITLKTSALVLQFLLHEMALGLIFF